MDATAVISLTAILATIGLAVVGGLVAWMFRIDRGLTRVEQKLDDRISNEGEWKMACVRDRECLWTEIGTLRGQIGPMGERIMRLESRAEASR